jgi:hypothetical protein
MFNLHVEFLRQCMPMELHLQAFYPFFQFYVTEYVLSSVGALYCLSVCLFLDLFSTMRCLFVWFGYSVYLLYCILLLYCTVLKFVLNKDVT